MPVEDGNSYLPSSERLVDVFNVVVKTHYTVGNTIEHVRDAPWEKVAQATSDFFTAGVAYFANRGHDQYMQEVGTTAWWIMNQLRVATALTDNMIAAAIQLGMPPQLALTMQSKHDEPHVLFAATKGKQQVEEVAYVLIPPEFIVKAQTKPIEALATMAWICSHVRDMANGRLTVDQPNINPRAEATEAHFLHHAVAQQSETILAPSYKRVMLKYPRGINSLPERIRYRGISGLEFTSSANN